LFDDDPLVATTPDPPTPEGRYVRGGCGLVFGVVMGWCIAIRFLRGDIGIVTVVAVAFGVIAAICSARYGDRFWFSATSAFRSRFRGP
jgi:hypothetical protein